MVVSKNSLISFVKVVLAGCTSTNMFAKNWFVILFLPLIVLVLTGSIFLYLMCCWKCFKTYQILSTRVHRSQIYYARFRTTYIFRKFIYCYYYYVFFCQMKTNLHFACKCLHKSE